MLVELSNIKKQACRKALCRVPPSPTLMLELYTRYKALVATNRLSADSTFEQYFDYWCSDRRSQDYFGLDDGQLEIRPSTDEQLINRVSPQFSSPAPELIKRPERVLKGEIRTLVLLVDFDDRPHEAGRAASYYEQMLFGAIGVFPTGSMAEYYRRISNYKSGAEANGIDIVGKVHGWFRMPRTSDYYTNSSSGMREFPRNTQGLAKDAVEEAKKQGVDFSGYDVFGEGIVTALFIIHSGGGAETTGQRSDFWSLKWIIPNGVEVGDGMRVTTFLTVPEDCQMGVCAHEWGHLAARWADYYDTGKSAASLSNGLGNYCLMASGSWNNGGITPCLPNGMLRMFHGWIKPEIITKTTAGIKLKPAAEGGSIVIIRSPKMTDSQYIFAEYRRRRGQDHFLPDEGVAIYMVDEAVDNVNDENNLAIELIQADNRRDMARVFGQGNRGDADDLYPSTIQNKEVFEAGEETEPSLSYPDKDDPSKRIWSGVTITVKGKPGDLEMTIDVKIDAKRAAKRAAKGAAKGASKRASKRPKKKRPGHA